MATRRCPTGLSLEQKIKFYGHAVADDGCWIWTGFIALNGYGNFRHDGKRIYAHRGVYELNHGPIPAGLVVRHRCDNRSCVNPEHLEIGTPLDNNNDKVARGRQQRGSGVPQAVLTEALVTQIRYRYAAGGISRTELALIHGVNKVTMGDLLERRTWAHVE